jgi:hypothetical protein
MTSQVIPNLVSGEKARSQKQAMPRSGGDRDGILTGGQNRGNQSGHASSSAERAIPEEEPTGLVSQNMVDSQFTFHGDIQATTHRGNSPKDASTRNPITSLLCDPATQDPFCGEQSEDAFLWVSAMCGPYGHMLNSPRRTHVSLCVAQHTHQSAQWIKLLRRRILSFLDLK